MISSMDVLAKSRFLRLSPRKMRLVADLIRGLSVTEADAQLSLFQRAAALPLRKLLQSAIANAEHNFKLHREALRIKQITVDGGPTLKRFRPRAMGRAATIRKRTSHVTILLTDQVPSIARVPKKEKKKSSIRSAVSAPKKNFPS